MSFVYIITDLMNIITDLSRCLVTGFSKSLFNFFTNPFIEIKCLINGLITGWDYSKVNKPGYEAIPLKYNVPNIMQHLPCKEASLFAKKTAIPAGIMLFNLNGNLNIGLAIRTAAAFGFSDVYVVGSKKYDARSEVGAKNYITIHRIKSISNIKKWFNDKRLFPIIIEQGGIPLDKINFFNDTFKSKTNEYKPIFIFGSESNGLPIEFLTELKEYPKISIPQLGLIRSLNVTSAVTVILYEYQRQLRQKMIGVL